MICIAMFDIQMITSPSVPISPNLLKRIALFLYHTLLHCCNIVPSHVHRLNYHSNFNIWIFLKFRHYYNKTCAVQIGCCSALGRSVCALMVWDRGLYEQSIYPLLCFFASETEGWAPGFNALMTGLELLRNMHPNLRWRLVFMHTQFHL